MTAPFIFISTHAIEEGKVEGFKHFLWDLFKVLEANAPRALAVNAYISPDGTEVAIVQVHEDAESIKEYWKIVHRHTARELAQFVDAATSTQIYGDPGDLGLARRHSGESGATVSVKPEHLGGFTRLATAAG